MDVCVQIFNVISRSTGLRFIILFWDSSFSSGTICAAFFLLASLSVYDIQWCVNYVNVSADHLCSAEAAHVLTTQAITTAAGRRLPTRGRAFVKLFLPSISAALVPLPLFLGSYCTFRKSRFCQERFWALRLIMASFPCSTTTINDCCRNFGQKLASLALRHPL